MAQQYQPGQRWISDSEAELGLGTVLAQDGRLLTVLYPATGETRQYALRNAPLTRVRFSPGDTITHFEGWKMTVREVDDVDGLMVYHGLNGQNEAVTLPETQLSNFIQFRLASDRLFAGQIDPLPWFSLRYNTLEHTSRQLQSSLWASGGVRAQPIAHQLHIAREVADRIAPRVLLADEVGLGKTIEAGLVIHRQLLSGRANRVLILVPENLQHQWLVEMRRRFNLQVALFDEERFIESDATNPFEDTQLALVALEWLVEDEKAQDALFAAGWDLMVVDEAHHLVWHEDKVSPEYALVEQLAEVIPGVLLLTATRNNSARTATLPVCACSTRTVSTTWPPSAPRARTIARWPKPCRSCSTRDACRRSAQDHPRFPRQRRRSPADRGQRWRQRSQRPSGA